MLRSSTAAGAEIAVLTFDHGPLNLFDQAMFDSLGARIADLSGQPPRALLLRAEGKGNSALVDRLADGPTKAHAATTEIIARWRSGGIHHADALTPESSGSLFDTDDRRRAVVSFRDVGPGKATYTGR